MNWMRQEKESWQQFEMKTFEIDTQRYCSLLRDSLTPAAAADAVNDDELLMMMMLLFQQILVEPF